MMEPVSGGGARRFGAFACWFMAVGAVGAAVDAVGGGASTGSMATYGGMAALFIVAGAYLWRTADNAKRRLEEAREAKRAAELEESRRAESGERDYGVDSYPPA